MEISRAEQSIIKYNAEQYRLQQIRVEDNRARDYAKIIERRNREREIAERVSRNICLDLDKGRNIDIEC
jgi:hypothetical protein